MPMNSESATSAAQRFENLFEMSPVPTLEQDYTRVVEWMDGLRSDGVHSIRDYFDRDIERVRDAAEKIDNVAVNPAAVAVIGLPAEAVTGPVDRDIVNPEALDAWIERERVPASV